MAALIGFVDAFLTISEAGVLRWEVDLLGVHPAQRGRGVAAALIAASVKAGFAIGADRARALVRIENVASRKAFERCGFQAMEAEQILYVGDQMGADCAAGHAEGLSAAGVHADLQRPVD